MHGKAAAVGHKNGHALSTKTFRSNVTMDYTVLTHLGKANNGQDCAIIHELNSPCAINRVIPHKCDLTIT